MSPPPITINTCKCTQLGNEGRNLVVCIDGTSHRFGVEVGHLVEHISSNSQLVQTTNVVTLYSKLFKDRTQLTYYSSGIGTYANRSGVSFKYWLQPLESALDKALAW